MAQFDKLAKPKGGRWKVSLSKGIFHIRGRDYLFTRALMEGQF